MKAVPYAEVTYEDMGCMTVNLSDFTPIEIGGIPWERFDHRPRTSAEAMDEKLGDLIEDPEVLGPVLMSQQIKRLSVNELPAEHTVPEPAGPLLQPSGPGPNEH